MSTTDEKVRLAQDALRIAADDDFPLTAEEIVEASDAIDALTKIVSEAMAGMQLWQAQLALGGMLALIIEAETDDPLEQARLLEGALHHGRNYIGSGLDVDAWKASVRKSAEEVSRGTESPK